ncbi:unnamed protein product [Amoebophrya sp. A25]|nr:unnamed protein product [Amoebophrya sp. A25]|eukprot:GSA25T00000069001.1
MSGLDSAAVCRLLLMFGYLLFGGAAFSAIPSSLMRSSSLSSMSGFSSIGSGPGHVAQPLGPTGLGGPSFGQPFNPMQLSHPIQPCNPIQPLNPTQQFNTIQPFHPVQPLGRPDISSPIGGTMGNSRQGIAQYRPLSAARIRAMTESAQRRCNDMAERGQRRINEILRQQGIAQLDYHDASAGDLPSSTGFADPSTPAVPSVESAAPLGLIDPPATSPPAENANGREESGSGAREGEGAPSSGTTTGTSSPRRNTEPEMQPVPVPFLPSNTNAGAGNGAQQRARASRLLFLWRFVGSVLGFALLVGVVVALLRIPHCNCMRKDREPDSSQRENADSAVLFRVQATEVDPFLGQNLPYNYTTTPGGQGAGSCQLQLTSGGDKVAPSAPFPEHFADTGREQRPPSF